MRVPLPLDLGFSGISVGLEPDPLPLDLGGGGVPKSRMPMALGFSGFSVGLEPDPLPLGLGFSGFSVGLEPDPLPLDLGGGVPKSRMPMALGVSISTSSSWAALKSAANPHVGIPDSAADQVSKTRPAEKGTATATQIAAVKTMEVNLMEFIIRKFVELETELRTPRKHHRSTRFNDETCRTSYKLPRPGVTDTTVNKTNYLHDGLMDGITGVVCGIVFTKN